MRAWGGWGRRRHRHVTRCAHLEHRAFVSAANNDLGVPAVNRRPISARSPTRRFDTCGVMVEPEVRVALPLVCKDGIGERAFRSDVTPWHGRFNLHAPALEARAVAVWVHD